MDTPAIVIDPEFQNQICKLRKRERDELEQDILVHGCMDALKVWKTGQILVDGHNRYGICMKHNLPFNIKEIDFPDREHVADWIDKNQVGRRNLTEKQFEVVVGRIYNRTEKKEGAPSGNNNKSTRRVRQVDSGGSTREKIAEQYDMTPDQVRHASELATAVEIVKTVDPDIEAKISEDQAPSRKAIIDAAKEIKKDNPEVAKQVKQAKQANITISTPSPLIERGRQEQENPECYPEIQEETKEKVKNILSPKRPSRKKKTGDAEDAAIDGMSKQKYTHLKTNGQKVSEESKQLIGDPAEPHPANQHQIKDFYILSCADGISRKDSDIYKIVTKNSGNLVISKEELKRCLEFWIPTYHHPYRLDVSQDGEYRLLKEVGKVPDVKRLRESITRFFPIVDKIIEACSQGRIFMSYAALSAFALEIRNIRDHINYFLLEGHYDTSECEQESGKA